MASKRRYMDMVTDAENKKDFFHERKALLTKHNASPANTK